MEDKKTKIINIKSKEPYDVFIGRPSVFGNPFSHLNKSAAEFKVATREEAVAKYKEWILTKPELLAKLPELKGKTLACFCKPLSCHGDVLIELIESLKYESIF